MQPARRGDDDVDAARAARAPGRCATPPKTSDGREPRAAGEGAEALADLHRELARRREHQRPAGLRRGAGVQLEQLVEDRQRERRRLAGAGLGAAEDVAARQLRRDRAATWMGVGVSKPVRFSASVSGRASPKSAKVVVVTRLSFPRGLCRSRLSPSSGADDENCLLTMSGAIAPSAPSWRTRYAARFPAGPGAGQQPDHRQIHMLRCKNKPEVSRDRNRPDSVTVPTVPGEHVPARNWVANDPLMLNSSGLSPARLNRLGGKQK